MYWFTLISCGIFWICHLMRLVLSRMERIGSTGVVASRSFQNILSVLYKDGLGRFVEDLGGIVGRNCKRIIERGL